MRDNFFYYFHRGGHVPDSPQNPSRIRAENFLSRDVHELVTLIRFAAARDHCMYIAYFILNQGGFVASYYCDVYIFHDGTNDRKRGKRG